MVHRVWWTMPNVISTTKNPQIFKWKYRHLHSRIYRKQEVLPPIYDIIMIVIYITSWVFRSFQVSNTYVNKPVQISNTCANKPVQISCLHTFLNVPWVMSIGHLLQSVRIQPWWWRSPVSKPMGWVFCKNSFVKCQPRMKFVEVFSLKRNLL